MRMRYRYHLNFAGILYLGVTVLVGLAATIRPNNLLVWVFGLLLGMIVLSGIISGFMLLRLKVARLDPVHGRVDRPLEIRYAVNNRSILFPSFDIQVCELMTEGLVDFVEPAEAWVMHAGPRETVHASAIMVPRRRGRMSFSGIRAMSTFPFGFIGKSVRVRQEMETLIFPRTVPLSRESIEALLGRGGMGGRSARTLGHGVDYFGLREYQKGDSTRSIAWKRVRPDDDLVVIQRSSSAPPRMMLVLDLRRTTSTLRVDRAGGVSARDLEEQAISLAASLAESADSMGVECGLQVAGCDLITLPIRGGRRHVDRILAHLAAIDLDGPRRVHPEVSSPGNTATVVIHPDRVDPSIGGEDAWHLLPGSLEDFKEIPAVGAEEATKETAA